VIREPILTRLLILRFQHSGKSALRDHNCTNHLHAFLPLFLLLKELLFSGDVSSIKLGSHVFSIGRDRGS